MSAKKSKEDILIEMWDLFDSIVQKNGYTIQIHDGDSLGRGTIAFKNTDKWIPTLRLNVWGNNEVSIHVKNRCGSSILNEGATIAIYQYDGTDIKVFENMLQYAINKWGKYNKQNPFIFTAGEDKEERLRF